MKSAAAFVITTSRRLPGARLSLAGQWGNVPFPDADAAEAEARRLGGDTAHIRRESAR